MHELSIASRLLDRALTVAREHDAARVDELTVELGRATHVNPDQLRFCLETAATDTPAEDATVDIETVQPHARCECGWAGTPDSLDVAIAYAPDVHCPACDARADLERGRECRLASIEIPDEHAGEREAEHTGEPETEHASAPEAEHAGEPDAEIPGRPDGGQLPPTERDQ